MKILALSLFTALLVLLMSSHWRSAHTQSEQLNLQIRPGAPTASDIQSGLETLLPALGQLSSINAEMGDFDLLASSTSHANNQKLFGTDLDPNSFIRLRLNDFDDTIRRTRLLLQHLQNQPLAFNGEQGFELNDLLNNILMYEADIITILHDQTVYSRAPKHSQRTAKLNHLEEEYSENLGKLLLGRDTTSLWFSQYLRSVRGVSTKVDDEASSKTRLEIERMRRQYEGEYDTDDGPGTHFDCTLIPSKGQNNPGAFRGPGDNRYACSVDRPAMSEEH